MIAPRISDGRPLLEEGADPRRRVAAEDLRAGDDRGREAGDRVRIRVAVELEQERLQRVEGVDADPGGERGRQHHPAHRRVSQPIVDRRVEDRLRRLQRALGRDGREAEVMHHPPRDREHHEQYADAHEEGNAERGGLCDHAAGDRSAEHRDAADHLAAAEHRFEPAVVAGGVERIHEPRLDGAGEEGEAEAEQHRDDRPLPEGSLDDPEQVVEKGRAGERDGAEQVGGTPAPRVGNDSRRDLEDHHPGREERVGRERLQVREARVEQEERIDAPDERRGQGVPEQQRQVCALDPAGEVVHPSVLTPGGGDSCPFSSRARGRAGPSQEI